MERPFCMNVINFFIEVDESIEFFHKSKYFLYENINIVSELKFSRSQRLFCMDIKDDSAMDISATDFQQWTIGPKSIL